MSQSYELRQALVALYNADSQVRTVTSRSSGNLIPRSRLATATLPVTTYHIVFDTDAGGTTRTRVMVQFDVWADPQQNTTPAHVDTLLDRAEALFTTTNLAAQSPSVDAAVYKGSRRDNFPQQDGVFGAGLDITFEII
jgi:hypothetical protein